MRGRSWVVGALSAALALVALGHVLAQEPVFRWTVPAPFPRPPVPSDNPMSAAKVELGRRLFYDRRMSANGRQSCASCHRQELAFTDGEARAVGTNGAVHPRGSMSLANIAYSPALTWANPALASLEEQARIPMFGTEPVELGLAGHEERFLRQLASDSVYRRLFPRAYPESDDRYTIENVIKTIAAFERTLVSMRSPYDRYRYGGEQDAISEAAKRGEAFFFSGQRGGCFQCHGGWNLSGTVRHEGDSTAPAAFFNTGLYNVAGAVSYPATNTGVHQFTRRAEDVGKFRPPSLRNVAVTAPYMHDGSIATLGEVLDHYAAGGRTIASGPHAGVGRENPNRAPNLRGFAMTDQEKRDVIALLESFTDSAFLHNPAYADPWKPRGATTGGR